MVNLETSLILIYFSSTHSHQNTPSHKTSPPFPKKGTGHIYFISFSAYQNGFMKPHESNSPVV